MANLTNVIVTNTLSGNFHIFQAPTFFQHQPTGVDFLVQLLPLNGQTLRESLVFGGQRPIKITDGVITLELRDTRGNYVRSDQILKTLELRSREKNVCHSGDVLVAVAQFKNRLVLNPSRVVLCDQICRATCVGIGDGVEGPICTSVSVANVETVAKVKA